MALQHKKLGYGLTLPSQWIRNQGLPLHDCMLTQYAQTPSLENHA